MSESEDFLAFMCIYLNIYSELKNKQNSFESD